MAADHDDKQNGAAAITLLLGLFQLSRPFLLYSSLLAFSLSVLWIIEREVGFYRGSPTRNAVTYGVVKTLSKAIKTSYISWCYLHHVGIGSTSHDAIQSDVVIWMSKFFKCSTFADVVKATSTKGRPLKTPYMQRWQLLGQRQRVHAWCCEKFILLFKSNIFATSPHSVSWKPHSLSTLFVRCYQSSILLMPSSLYHKKVLLMTSTDLWFFVVIIVIVVIIPRTFNCKI